jgi:AraC-like DNA-binding protein
VEGSDTARQKITPDGFPELIFHFGDPYIISIYGKPDEVQPCSIAAGQIDKPFFLKPTGKSGVIGIKFKPTGMWKYFGCDMRQLTNVTVPLAQVMKDDPGNEVVRSLRVSCSVPEKISIIENFLIQHTRPYQPDPVFDSLVDAIRNSGGQIAIKELLVTHGLQARKLERLFLQQVGVPAKLYARLVRFNHVFKLLQQPELTKAEATYLSGYFDQAHFNKEFREFTGENPQVYFLQNHSFSNFFLNR